jgi:uncharacterized repeat protein (TIGR01451 family)
MFKSAFAATLLLVTFLAISEPAAALQTQRATRAHAINPLDAQDCSVYPIAINVNSLAGLHPGESTGDLYNGVGVGNFGWLRWSDEPGHTSSAYLLEELQDPTLSFTDFEEASPPGDDTDHTLNAGDWVWSLAGINTSDDMRDMLTGLVNADTVLRVPVWDATTGYGTNLAHHVDRFILITLTDISLAPGQGGWIRATFVGEDPAACPEPADLAIAKSVSLDEVQPGQALTYTLTFSNAGVGPALGVVISDELPLVLTDTHFTHSGAAITPTGGITYAWQVQDLAQDEGGVITVTGRVRPDLDGGFTFTNSAVITGTNAESDTGNNVGAAPVLTIRWIHLPVIFKRG